MITTKNSNAAARFIFTATDDELLDELDVLVRHATQGDGPAVGAIAIGFGPMLIRVARIELGLLWHHLAADVVQELHVRLLAGELAFPPIRGAAIPWLKRAVRAIAREHLEKERPWGDAAE
jgi:DNA-directed RNA polymerase specialized sigma24 family protein